MAEPIDIQQKLDEWLASNPAAQKYVSKLWYIPDNHPAPEGVTHTIRLASKTSGERQLTIGMVVLPQFAVVLDALLAMIATSGGTIPGGILPEKA